VCNFSRDNSDRARHIFKRVIDLLKPQESVCHDVVRGRMPIEA
jgi:hypothetical protein